MRAEKARDGGATATAMDGAMATQHNGRRDGNGRRDRDVTLTAATAMEGVLVSRISTVFYGESVLEIFASFDLDKYVRTCLIHTLSR